MSHLSFSSLSRMLAVLPLAVVVLILAGCSGGKGSIKDSVSGKVTLSDGKAVAGEVIFVFSDGKESRSPIAPDGSYSVLALAKGEAKIGVKGMMASAPPPGAKSDMPGMPGASGVPPPAKYATPASSGLTFTVKGGEEKHDIALTP